MARALAPATGSRVALRGPAIRLPATVVLAVLGLALVTLARAQVGTVLGVKFAAEGFTNIGQVLAPLLLMALFIERATEVVITSWRDPESQRLQHELDAAGDANRLQAQQAVDFYRLETQRLAFLISAALAIVAAVVGLRIIQPLLDPSAVQRLADPVNAARIVGQPAPDGVSVQAAQTQWFWLSSLDVVLTGLLIAGGADGIHQVITTFTTFLDSTRDRAATLGGPAPAAPQPAAPVQQSPALAAPAAAAGTVPPQTGVADGT